MGLVSEEADTFDDLAVSLLHHIGSQRWGQLREKGLPVAVVSNGSGLVFKEILDLGLGVDGQVVFERVLCESVEFGIEEGGFGVHTGDDATDVADGKGVEVDSDEHPQESEHVLALSGDGKVAVSDRRDCLESPVHGVKVLITLAFVDDASGTDPCVIQIVFKSGREEPEARHQMDHEYLDGEHIEHSNHTGANVERTDPLLEFGGLSEDPQHLHHSQDSNEPIQSRQPSKSCQL